MADIHPSHLWLPGKFIPPMREHSRAKHRALAGYIRRYIAAYTQNFRVQRLSLTIVEGFAGGNVYNDEITDQLICGSPGVILNAANEAIKIVKNSRINPFKFSDKYFFVEKHPGAFDSLKSTLEQSEYSSRIGGDIQLINGDFLAVLPSIIQKIRSFSGDGRALYILDQCGYKDVPFDVVSNILQSSTNSEVILTFAFDFLTNYLSDIIDTTSLQNKTGIDFQSLKGVSKSNPNWRLLVQSAFSDDLIKKTGAKYFTPFFIRSEDSNRDLWLVHLSQHVKARDEMGELHWDIQTAAAHYGRPGTRMLGFDPRKSVAETSVRLPGFAFDKLALQDSLEALCEELPRRIFNDFGNISFIELFKKLANETPATRRIVKMALKELHYRKELVFKDHTGQTYRKGSIQEDSDIIVIPKTKSLFLPF